MEKIKDFAGCCTVEDVIEYYKINTEEKQYPEWFLKKEITKEAIDDIKAFHNISVEELIEHFYQFGQKSDLIIRAACVNDEIVFYFNDILLKKFKPMNENFWIEYNSLEDISYWFKNKWNIRELK